VIGGTTRSNRAGCALALLLMLSTSILGCWSRTDGLTPGVAGPGEAGFGASMHTHVMYAVLAAAVARIYASANVAMVDAGTSDLPLDSVWQSHDGGRRVRHCFVVDDGKHICADAEMSVGWGKSVVFIDPVNLGRFLEVVQVSGGDQQITTVAGGLVLDADARLPVAPGHGVWGLVAGDNTIMHCQLEKATPRCRALPPDSTLFVKVTLLDSILGVFVIGNENVLWLAKPGGVFRCTASLARPEPTCVAARME
jgi:hypothetical protein